MEPWGSAKKGWLFMTNANVFVGTDNGEPVLRVAKDGVDAVTASNSVAANWRFNSTTTDLGYIYGFHQTIPRVQGVFWHESPANSTNNGYDWLQMNPTVGQNSQGDEVQFWTIFHANMNAFYDEYGYLPAVSSRKKAGSWYISQPMLRNYTGIDGTLGQDGTFRQIGSRDGKRLSVSNRTRSQIDSNTPQVSDKSLFMNCLGEIDGTDFLVWAIPADATRYTVPTGPSQGGTPAFWVCSQDRRVALAKKGYDARTSSPRESIFSEDARPAQVVASGFETLSPGATFTVDIPGIVTDDIWVETQAQPANETNIYEMHRHDVQYRSIGNASQNKTQIRINNPENVTLRVAWFAIAEDVEEPTRTGNTIPLDCSDGKLIVRRPRSGSSNSLRDVIFNSDWKIPALVSRGRVDIDDLESGPSFVSTSGNVTITTASKRLTVPLASGDYSGYIVKAWVQGLPILQPFADAGDTCWNEVGSYFYRWRGGSNSPIQTAPGCRNVQFRVTDNNAIFLINPNLTYGWLAQFNQPFNVGADKIMRRLSYYIFGIPN